MSQPGGVIAGENVLILAASGEAASGFGWPIGFVVVVASGGVGFAARKWWSTREPADESLNDRRVARRRQEAENKAIFKAGMAAGGVTSLLSRFALFGFAGWEWIEPMQFAVLGMIASTLGAALSERLGVSPPALGSEIEGATQVAASDQKQSEDGLDWSRKVQRGSLSLKRLGHRKTLYLVSCGYWMSHLVTSLIARVVLEIEGGASWMRSQRDGWTDWFTSGTLTRASEVMDQTSAGVQLLFGLLLLWDWLALIVTGCFAAWSLYWLHHDARVRVADGEPKGVFLREVRWVIAINLLAWFGLRVAFGV